MSDWLERVRTAYDADPEAEWQRLEWRVQNRIEYLVTLHALERHLPPPDPTVRVLDAGGGPGRYTIALAERGYTTTLLDLSTGNVSLARRRIDSASQDVAARVEATIEGSITDLSHFLDAQFDAVLCLGGVLSHVIDRAQQVRALAELQRVAKPDAPLLISVGNVIFGLRGLVQQPCPPWTAPCADPAADPEETTRLGNLECGAPYYWFMPEEFAALLEEVGLRLVRLYGCQGIAAHLPWDHLEALMADPVRWPTCRRLLLATCDHPNVVGLSGHLIAVAQRAADY
ncbi:MAG: class I SAM-dependent methyltransferase [Dehalococcoidia bacterium]